MTHRFLTVAAVAMMTTVTSAQTPAPQTPAAQDPVAPKPPAIVTQTPTVGPTDAAAAPAGQEPQVTIVGCVVREADFRKGQAAGRGGAAGTGIGVGNEFILANASTSSKPAGGAVGTSGVAAPAAAGTSGSSVSYELTGSNEGQAQQFVGKRVEITGRFKAAEVGAAGPTGGPTAGAPPSGIDLTPSKDLKLRELEVASVRETAGSCSAN